MDPGLYDFKPGSTACPLSRKVPRSSFKERRDAKRLAERLLAIDWTPGASGMRITADLDTITNGGTGCGSPAFNLRQFVLIEI